MTTMKSLYILIANKPTVQFQRLIPRANIIRTLVAHTCIAGGENPKVGSS